MEKEQSKNLLVWGAIILAIQNIILVIILIIGFVAPDVVELITTITLWVDLIGFILVGVGMQFIGDFYTSVADLTKRTSLLVFAWVILSFLWRIIMGVLIPELYLLGTPDINNLGLYVVLPPVLFGAAALVLMFIMIYISKIMTAFFEQEGIGKGGGNLFTGYAVVHIVGAGMIVIGWAPLASILFDPSGITMSGLESAAGGLLLMVIGFLIKIIVIPILGIITFLGVKNSFQTIEV